jgi:excisionase family DNA binding protein
MHCGMNNLIKNIFSPAVPTKIEKLCYSIAEAAAILHISKRDLYEQIKQKKIRAVQIEKGESYRISCEEVERVKNSDVPV